MRTVRCYSENVEWAGTLPWRLVLGPTELTLLLAKNACLYAAFKAMFNVCLTHSMLPRILAVENYLRTQV